jgi:protein O-GlcNAc transferase
MNQPYHHLEAMQAGFKEQMTGNLEAAEKIYTAILQQSPHHSDALCLLGAVRNSLGYEFHACIVPITQALGINATNPIYHFHHGEILLDHHQAEAAIHAFTQSLSLAPANNLALLGLAIATQRLRRYEESEAAYRKLLALSPDHLKARNGLAFLLIQQGLVQEALAAYKEMAKAPIPANIYSNLLLYLNYDPAQTPQSLLTAHKEWNTRYALPVINARLPYSNTRTLQKKLRIGYISADFCDHPVAYFLLPALQHRNHRQVEYYCYSATQREDFMTLKIKQYADSWQQVSRLDDEKLAGKIRADGIDILVDLSGHTAGNRLGVFARKPAPVQVSWIGYFNTTGLEAIDYFISDAMHIPSNLEEGFTEKIIRLPDAYIAYAPRFALTDRPRGWLNNIRGLFTSTRSTMPAPEATTTPPSIRNGYITFGSFNNIAKINSNVIALWAEILGKLPTARLILQNAAFDIEAVRIRYLEAFAAHGIDHGRIELRGWTTVEVLYHSYNEIDIALDTFPFNGGATSCDALWMRVPLITLSGNQPVSRQSATYLTQLGLSELITSTPADYVALAIALAGDTAQLSALRGVMRERLLTSPLCDHPRFAKNLEAAYRHMWYRWCNHP